MLAAGLDAAVHADFRVNQKRGAGGNAAGIAAPSARETIPSFGQLSVALFASST
jgi:hypothetical protein